MGGMGEKSGLHAAGGRQEKGEAVVAFWGLHVGFAWWWACEVLVEEYVKGFG